MLFLLLRKGVASGLSAEELLEGSESGVEASVIASGIAAGKGWSSGLGNRGGLRVPGRL